MQKAICLVFTRLSDTRLHRAKLESQDVHLLARSKVATESTYVSQAYRYVYSSSAKLMEKNTSYVVTCKTYPVINKGLENWPAVAPCTTLQLVDIKLFTLKVYEVCLNCWNTVSHQGIRILEFVESVVIGMEMSGTITLYTWFSI